MEQRNKLSKLVILAIIGTVLFFLFQFILPQTAPESSTPAEPSSGIGKNKAKQIADDFVRRQLAVGDSEALRFFVTYRSRQDLSGYLQKSGLYPDYAKSLLSQIPLDYYQVEVLDETGGSRFYINMSMDKGEVSGWIKEISANTDIIAADEEVLTAEQFIRNHGYDPNSFELLEGRGAAGQTTMYPFVFESKTASVGEAKLQLKLRVEDGLVVTYTTDFRLPDSFVNWKKSQDSAAYWMGLFGTLIFPAALGIAAIIITVRNRKIASFGRGTLLTVVFTLVYCINNINMYPAFKGAGENSETYSASGLYVLLFSNFIIMLMGAALYVSFAAGDTMWRQAGRRVWAVWSEASYGRHIVKSMGRGYLLCMTLLGVQAVLFFIAEKYFGMWAISDPSSSPFNMLWPWLFPLLAWCAAISEEATYRLFGIAFFTKLFRIRFLAVLIPSVMWALGHTQYAIYPVYTRLVEVTVLGLIFGYAFLRYGLITVLFAHASMDSILMGFSVMSLGNGGNVLTGLLYMASPLIVAFAIQALHNRFRPKAPPGEDSVGKPPLLDSYGQ